MSTATTPTSLSGPVPARRAIRRTRARDAVGLWRLVVVVVLLACWEVLPRLLPLPEAFVVPLSEAVRTGVSQWSTIQPALWPTLSAVLIALAVTWVLGIAVGFLVATADRLRFLGVIFAALYAVPFVVVYPLITVWLGPGQTAKVVFASLYGFIPVVLTTISGIRAVDDTLQRLAASMGATRLQLLTKILLPAALPVIMTGLRLGGGLVLIGVIVGEMLASTSGGVGTLVTAFRVQFNAGGVYFCILLVLIFALIMDRSLAFVERRVVGRSNHRKVMAG